jgi:hypothetical protein
VRPLVLLDVDGPLSPWAANERTRPPGYVEHRLRVGPWWWSRPLRIWLNPGHGPALLGLAERFGAELAWATSWDHRANAMIGPAIGLPVLPVVEVAAHLELRPGCAFRWKFGAVARYAAGRPLAWLDDDFDVYPAARDEFVAKRERDGLPTELITVNPRTGITDEHLATIENWARQLPT